MALDVYVMPIWKFKAGDFSSPLEQLGITPTIISPDGISRRQLKPKAGFFARWKAKRQTARLRREVETEIGHPVSWNDEGDLIYSEQAAGFESLRAFARWLDCRDVLPNFDEPPENNYYKHPAMSADLKHALSYPQLVNHSCYSGYYLPADLERVVFVEPYRSFGNFVFKRSVGSAPRLLNELKRLAPILKVEDEYQWEQSDPLREVKAAFSQLYKVARISLERNLPIVFWG